MLLTLLIKQEENSADSLSVAKPRRSNPPISADRTSILRPSALPAGQDWWPEGGVPFASCWQHKMRARGGKNLQEKVNQPTIRMSPKRAATILGPHPTWRRPPMPRWPEGLVPSASCGQHKVKVIPQEKGPIPNTECPPNA